MPQLALAIAGAEVGSLFGSQVIGWAVGSFLGNALFGAGGKTQGPRLADLKAAQIGYGTCIPYIEGAPRVGGIPAWASDKQPHDNTTSVGGKGGGTDVTTTTYTQDIFYLLSENVCWDRLLRVWRNGELVGDASEVWDEIIFYPGGPTQMPDPTYEAAQGVGNAQAFRTRAAVMVRGLKTGTSGQLPNLTFQGAQGGQQVLGQWVSGMTGYRRLIWQLPADLLAYRYVEGSFTSSGGSWSAMTRCYYQPIDMSTGTPVLGARVLQAGYADAPLSGTTDDPAALLAQFESGFYDSFAGIRSGTGAVGNFSYEIFGTSQDGDNIVLAAPGDAVAYSDPDHQGDTVVIDSSITLTIGGDADYPVMAPMELQLVTIYDHKGPTLQSVVERQCLRAGYTLDQIDASALSGLYVRAMAISQLSSPRQVLEMLMAAYRITAVESDVLRFVLRGGASVATIPYEDLVANGDAEPLPIKRANDIELPAQVIVKYANVLDDMNDASEMSDRLISSGNGVTQIEFPLGMTPSEAKALADFLVIDAVAANTHFGPFSVTRDYAELEPTDVVTLTDFEGNQYRVRLTKKTEVGGVLTFEGVSDDGNVVLNTAIGTTSIAGYSSSTTVRQPVDTTSTLLDIPILRDADDDAGLYAGAKSASNVSFPGAALYKANDNVTFASVATLPNAAVFGVTQSVLGAGVVGMFDEKNSVTVYVPYGQLASFSRDDILNTASGLYLIGNEIVQARNGPLVAPYTYQLSGFLRGLRGTEWAMGTHVSGERVVRLDTALRRVTLSTSDIGVAEYWKAVTLGRSLDTAISSAFTNAAVGKKPFAPVNVRRAISGADAVITWDRRSRLQDIPLTGSILLGEESESYEIDVTPSGGATTTYTTTGASLTVTGGAASLTAGSTVAVYQMSAVVGRGYAGALTL